MADEIIQPVGLTETRRARILEIITNPNLFLSQLLNAFLILLIGVNVVLVMYDSLMTVSVSQHQWIRGFNIFSIMVFTAEYILRVWTVVDRQDKKYRRPILGRIRYMLGHRTLIDLAAILPFYLYIFGPLPVAFFEATRLLWIFKLLRYRPKLLDTFMIVLVSLNLLSVIFESVTWIYEIYKDWFDVFEIGAVTIFTVEYVLRFLSAPEKRNKAFHHPILGRLRYLISPMGVIDLISIMPFVLSFFMPGIDHTILNVLKTIRTAKLIRYSAPMQLLLSVLREEARMFGAALFLLLFIALLAAGGIYLVESPHQPEAFGSIPSALYWALVTLTTIGYGDVIPITPIGKMLSTCIGIIAIGMMAMPAGILASAISDKIRRSRREYESKVEKILRDNRLSEEEQREEIEHTREKMGLKQDDASRAMEQHAVLTGRAFSSCPHCGKPLNSARRRPRSSTSRPTRDRS